MNPEDRLLAFADRLRQLRKTAQLTGKELAQSVGWQASKVSRLENGQQVITEADLDLWSEALELADEARATLRDELRGIRLDKARFRNRTASGHQVLQQSFGEAEQTAAVIRNLETGLVPGLLQTPDYARAVFTAFSSLTGSPDDADNAVSARLRRQSVLYDTDKKIDLLVTEAALRSPIAGDDVMAAQIDRLLALPGMPNVRFGIIPLGVRMPAPVMHGLWILDDVVSIEVTNTELATREPHDLKLYADLLAMLWKVAAEGDAARALLMEIANTYRAGATTRK